MRPYSRLRHRYRSLAAAAALGSGIVALCATHEARAQFAVIDVASVTQLIAQAQTLAQQLQALRSQITQAQQLYQSMTGSRGMQQLLNTSQLNYLPTDWSQLIGAMQGSGGVYGSLTADIASAITGNAVLSAAQVASLSPSEQASITNERQAVALLQGLVQEALTNSSGRFSDIQQLITAIPTASDQKGALELQATIGAELAMLQNEQTKLQSLYRATDAEQRANRQAVRELVVADQGRFSTRFEPTPP
jgi:type IV secretion system protein VirB5